MSDLTSKLNGIVLAGCCCAVGFLLFSRSTPIEPPDDAWFQQTVVNRPETVLVKFGAEWCGPCRMLEPELDKLAFSTRGRLSIVRVNLGEHTEVVQHYRVSSIPRLLLFRHGKVIADRVGYADQQQLHSWVASHSDDNLP